MQIGDTGARRLTSDITQTTEKTDKPVFWLFYSGRIFHVTPQFEVVSHGKFYQNQIARIQVCPSFQFHRLPVFSIVLSGARRELAKRRSEKNRIKME